MSRPSLDWAMPAEIARFLRLEPADVETLIKSDGLPATKIPRKTRSVKRVWLRDLHRWLVANTSPKTSALADYETFRTDFEKHRTPARRKESPTKP
jgi:hypothetical protein